MLSDIEELLAQLGLGSPELLSDTLAVDSRCFKVRDQRGRCEESDLILKIFEKGQEGSSDGLWDTGRWNTRAVDQWVTSSAGAPAGGDPDGGSKVVDCIQLNWMIAEQGGKRFFPKVVEIGEVEGYAYVLRPFLAQSLKRLGRTKIRINSEMLRNVIGGAWDALSFLHQPEVNLPHGNLKLGNLLVGKGPLQKAKVFLSDAVEKPETARKLHKRDDFQHLGQILYQLVSGDVDVPDPVEALVRQEGANWDVLGKDAKAWRSVAVALLEDAGSFDPDAVRKEFHQALAGKIADPPSVPRPHPAPPQGPPFAAGVTTPAKVSILADVDALIEKEDYVAALKCAIGGIDQAGAEEHELLARVGQCAEVMRRMDELDSSVLPLLEEGARRGVPHAALLLGLALQELDPGESATWLESARDFGLDEAVPPLARLIEFGWDGVDARPQEALDMLDQARHARSGSTFDYLYAAMILRGKTGTRETAAVPVLEGCAKQGDFRASDLLAQCYATGLGAEIDEKKAYAFFAEAWNLSKSEEAHYFNASNNLGVCFAIGFGVPKDMENAKHYFRQGALKGHLPSKENLERLDP